MITIELGNRLRNPYGEIIYKEKGLMDLLYSDDHDIHDVFVDPKTAENHNKICSNFDIPELKLKVFKTQETPEQYLDNMKQKWNISPKWKDIDLKAHLLQLCKDEVERTRVEEEYRLYSEKNMIDFLRAIAYIVEFFKDNGILWGVGRGSSVNSFILYLLDLHLINSIKWDLDIKEFLR